MTAPLSQRAAGVLLHPTSLPGPHGIGDLGPAVLRWLDALVAARQRCWQILPLGPTGFGDSPYQCFSAFAGNPYLISPELLQQDGLLRAEDLRHGALNDRRVDYGPAIQFKLQLLQRAWQNFRSGTAPSLRGPFEDFRHKQGYWLEDYVLFRAIKDDQGGAMWQNWPRPLLERQTGALNEVRRRLAEASGFHAFGQFLFARQWAAVRRTANERGIRIIGDAPIFVSADSADVWANPQFFQLDAQRKPKVVAGVPPDYFSSTGQLWGNPLYDWTALKASKYQWWVQRLRCQLEQVDIVRLDHFRGFEAYWEVPAGRTTAEVGRWVKGPDADLLQALRDALGGLPLVAEDLGTITPEVGALRDRFELPGMRILQFAFGGGSDNPYLPHNYRNPNTVVYTGTHDNNTTRGWYQTASDHEKDHVRRYLARDGGDIAWDLLRLAWSSVALTAIAPLQDVLNLGSEGRMNFPGQAVGNWGWRYTDDMITLPVLERLAQLTELYGRC